jgi:hypothetical protein
MINVLCFAADRLDYNMDTDNMTGIKKNVPDKLICDTYESCLKLGLEDREAKKKSVLIYFSDSNKDIRYNLFENINVRISPNTCPPLLNVYKSVNNINFLMDVYKKGENSDCIAYYSNIIGDGKNRDSVVGQLEIFYCNSDVFYENCENGIIYSKVNMFIPKKEKDSDNEESIKYKRDNKMNDKANMSIFQNDK